MNALQTSAPVKMIRIASRKSDLARIQAYQIGQALQDKFPQVQIDYLFRESLGDKNLTDPLWKIPEKGVFTQDFYQDLIQDKCDLVVHSWKDLAVEEQAETMIAATLPREDVRDVLFVKKAHFEKIKKHKNIFIYTSSPRRMFHFEKFARYYLPFEIQNCQFDSVRGNIQTRMRKMLENDQVDGMLMAKAGLDRLLDAPQEEFQAAQTFFKQAFLQLEFMILPVTTNPQAPAQGALAVEVKKSRTDLQDMLAAINHHLTYQNTVQERQILKSYGGGCHSQIGVSCFGSKEHQFVITSGHVNGADFETQEYHNAAVGNFHQRFFSEEIFCPRSADYFETTARPWETAKLKNSTSSHTVVAEVAKADYLTDFSCLKEVLCWTSGLDTWKKLASKNVWVHGSQESLGFFLPRPQRLFGRDLRWFKLTHEDAITYPGYQQHESVFSVGVAKLKDKRKFEDLANRKAFFWRSGSLFLKAIAEQPEIANRVHFCGLGETYQIVSMALKKINNSFLAYSFPNEKIWRDYVTKI